MSHNELRVGPFSFTEYPNEIARLQTQLRQSDEEITRLRGMLIARWSQWQLIETAPMDGTFFLGWWVIGDNEPRYEVMRREGSLWTDGEYSYTPTHWQSLPAGPGQGDPR